MPTGATERRKSYEQMCTVAAALDVIGDRWTVLLLRELLGGPARFQDLKDGLPGIATNLLTERLRRMETDGLVRRPEGGSTLYTLTERGAATRPLVEALGFWGGSIPRITPPVHERSMRALAVALQAILVRAAAQPPERVIVELESDGEFAEITLGPEPSVVVRPVVEPDARVRSTTADMSVLLAGRIAATDALQHVDGSESATRNLIRALG